MNGSDKDMREKIDAVTGMPGLSLDKEQAWQKLQLRLDTRPRQKARPIYYYGMAAAAVLAIICMVLFIPRTGDPVNKTVVSKAPSAGKSLPLPPAVEDHDTLVTQASELDTETPLKEAVVEVKKIEEPQVAKDSVYIAAQPAPPAVQPEAEVARMKVVHISDVAEETIQYVPAGNGSFLTFGQYKYRNNIKQPAPAPPPGNPPLN